MKKKEFIHITKLLNEKLNIVPLLFGSLGLEQRLDRNLDADDIDVLIPEAFLNEKWNSIVALMNDAGYALYDLREHAFEKSGLSISFADIESLPSFAGIDLKQIPIIEEYGSCYYLLSLQDYLKVYTASSKDGYRKNVKNKQDEQKIKLINDAIRTKQGEYVMSEWSSEQYLKFKKQRTQPAVDLAKRIAGKNPRTVLDVGCGPGNSTAVLQNAFPAARIIGIDSSEEMIEKAKTSCPDTEFRLCDITADVKMLENYDIIFSNACLQWVPDHRTLIPILFDKLNDGGVLAVQIPMNYKEPLFLAESEVLSEPQWGFAGKEIRTIATLPPEEYFDILASCTNDFDIWETVYYHRMPSVNAMVEWIKGTNLRPYLSALDEEKAIRLETKITERAAEVYAKQDNGEYIFKFRRFFFIAQK